MPARLIVEAGIASPTICELSPTQRTYLGRKRGSTVVLLDQHASRLHAEIYCENKHWFLRDCGTLNGTKLNGQRIREAVPLEEGAQIGIGDIRLRFSLATTDKTVVQKTETGSSETGLTRTALQLDELTCLVDFMKESQTQSTPRSLLQLALTLVKTKTGADLCGFLSLDRDQPLPKVVVPAAAEVNAQLSRNLTQQVLRDQKPIWLAATQGDVHESESLVDFTDALCIPLKASVQAAAAAEPAPPLGALHVYLTNRVFSERNVRFCEVLAGYLANSLVLLRKNLVLEADNSRLREGGATTQSDTLIGDSSAMQAIRQQIPKRADRSQVILITGESGVGKELVAMGLHEQSCRADGPLVVVNSASYNASMLESELFGHKVGAFTGAIRNRPGHFLLADEGTLFLDEIGELSQECQARLLRVLETGTFWPVGADEPVTVDVCVIVATNRDLQREVQNSRFRQDLFYRLGMAIQVPPLREHKEDIPALAEHFLDKLSERFNRRFRLTDEALQRLMVYSWPGNVRQLRIVLENAAAMLDENEEVIQAGSLRLEPEATPGERPPSLNLTDLERWAIREALAQTGGNKAQAAKILGIHRDTLTIKAKEMGLG
jgi:Nif-specific regulatory protein